MKGLGIKKFLLVRVILFYLEDFFLYWVFLEFLWLVDVFFNIYDIYEFFMFLIVYCCVMK